LENWKNYEIVYNKFCSYDPPSSPTTVSIIDIILFTTLIVRNRQWHLHVLQTRNV